MFPEFWESLLDEAIHSLCMLREILELVHVDLPELFSFHDVNQHPKRWLGFMDVIEDD